MSEQPILQRWWGNCEIGEGQARRWTIGLGYGESSLDIQFSVWVSRDRWLEVRRQVPVEIKEAFDEAGIEIPFPHRSLYAGSVTEPFPVRVVAGADVPDAIVDAG